MSAHERFRFKTLDDVRRRVDELGLDLEFDEDLSPLAQPIEMDGRTIPNRLIVHPMEGCDGERDGRPGELTIRRYERFARGGAGLLWFEATAIEHAGRANPRQLTITAQTLPYIKEMLDHSLGLAREANGAGFRPFTVLQLTFSGRYAKPDAKRAPVLAHHDGVLDKAMGIPADHPLITDDELDAMQGRWVEAARLAREAGFDAVDIKSCHRYLLSELLASFTRRRSQFGGEYENRTRMIRQTAEKVRNAVGEKLAMLCRRKGYAFIVPVDSKRTFEPAKTLHARGKALARGAYRKLVLRRGEEDTASHRRHLPRGAGEKGRRVYRFHLSVTEVLH